MCFHHTIANAPHTNLGARDQHLLFVFEAVVRLDGFTNAAEELGVTKSVVSAHLRTLEERLGVRLLERTTRQRRLTQIGAEVYERARSMVALSQSVGALIEAQHDRPVGTLRVGAQTDLGTRFVTPVLADLCQRYPDLDVEASYDDREIDLIDSAIEVTLRLGVPKDSRLIAKRLTRDREIIVAAPALAAHWSADKPANLRDAPWLGHREVSLPKIVFRGPGGARSELTVLRRRATVSTVSAALDFAAKNVGFFLVPKILANPMLRSGALVHVLPKWRWRKVGVYVVRPSREYTAPRVRVFIDAITRALQENDEEVSLTRS